MWSGKSRALERTFGGLLVARERKHGMYTSRMSPLSDFLHLPQAALEEARRAFFRHIYSVAKLPPENVTFSRMAFLLGRTPNMYYKRELDMGLAKGLYVAAPLLSAPFTRAAGRVPVPFLAREGLYKFPLQVYIRKLMPDFTAVKSGFPWNFNDWLEEPEAFELVYETLGKRQGPLGEYFIPTLVRRLLYLKRKGKPIEGKNHSFLVSALTTALWLEAHTKGPVVPNPWAGGG
jgi:hypothetical protein